ncbi:MAG: hypothetical protein EP343_04395 [Deltaproteobacteria bacterium]|nr:MAG: hypothetical protein EP343_04395 [Deltaproteobacteria bacterium]
MRIRFSWRLTLTSTAILLFAAVATTLTLQSCDRRACKAFTQKLDGGQEVEQVVNTPCKGYVCDKSTLVCKTSCKADDDCDKGSVAVSAVGAGTNSNTQSTRHFVCKTETGTCVCNIQDKSLDCHRWCETNDDCNLRNDPNFNKLLNTSRGYACVKLPSKSVRTCECRTPSAGCCDDLTDANQKRACQTQCQTNTDCDSVRDPATGKRLWARDGYICREAEGTSFKTCQCNPDSLDDKLPCKAAQKEPTEETPSTGEESSTGFESSTGVELPSTGGDSSGSGGDGGTTE